MTKNKYKVGDKVKIREDIGNSNPNPEIISPYMINEYAGREAEIEDVLQYGKLYPCFYKLNFGNGDVKYRWPVESFEGEYNQTIEIFSNKGTTVCLKKDNGEVVDSGVAKCNPSDKFNFMIGAEIAYKRMKGDFVDLNNLKKPEFYPIGAIVRVKKDTKVWKEHSGDYGKIQGVLIDGPLSDQYDVRVFYHLLFEDEYGEFSRYCDIDLEFNSSDIEFIRCE